MLLFVINYKLPYGKQIKFNFNNTWWIRGAKQVQVGSPFYLRNIPWANLSRLDQNLTSRGFTEPILWSFRTNLSRFRSTRWDWTLPWCQKGSPTVKPGVALWPRGSSHEGEPILSGLDKWVDHEGLSHGVDSGIPLNWKHCAALWYRRKAPTANLAPSPYSGHQSQQAIWTFGLTPRAPSCCQSHKSAQLQNPFLYSNWQATDLIMGSNESL